MTVRIITGDARQRLAELPDASVHCVVTSPPYWGLRDYGVASQIGLEPDFRDYIATMVEVFREVRRVLRADGTMWLNMGDSFYAGNKGTKDALDRVSAGTKQVTNAGSRYLRSPTRQPQASLKPKDLIGMPWRIAFALQEDGWWLRQDIIWHKPNPMPESVNDRPTTAHEYLFLLSKSQRYYYDAEAIRETAVADDVGDMDGGAQRLPDGGNANEGRNYRQPNSPLSIKSPHGQGFTRRAGIGAKGNARTFRGGSYVGGKPGPRTEIGNVPNKNFSRNKRTVWTIATVPFPEAHFATFPPALVEPCILAGCPKSGTVLDPFFGAGTTGLVADRLGRHCIGIELNPEYAEMARRRITRDAGLFAEVA